MSRKTLQNIMKALISVITILSLVTLASSSNASDQEQYYKRLSPGELGLPKREKLTHLHFYFHDVVSGKNATVAHITGPPPVILDPAAIFGFVAMMDDPLTGGPDPASKRIGSAQGIYASASQTELGFLMVLNYFFTEGKFNGSTLSILGRNAVFSEVREMPIVGGSGVFRFARGFAQAKTYMFNATTLDAIVEYNVYVLHY